MRISDFRARTAGVLGALALLAGCGGLAAGGGLSAIPPGISPLKNVEPGPSQLGPAADATARVPARAQEALAKNLYVANYKSSTVTVYAPGTSTPLRTIRNGIYPGPVALRFDGAENLYVVNQERVAVYAPKSTKFLRALMSATFPWAIAFDNSDNAYVSYPDEQGVLVYRAHTSEALRLIRTPYVLPGAMAFGSDGGLYVTDAVDYNLPPPYRVDVYTGVPLGKLVRSLTLEGLQGWPDAMAFDRRGDLYVSRTGETLGGHWYAGSVTVYAHGEHKVRTITDGAPCPWALTFDASENLYVANGLCNGRRGSISVYAPGQTKPARIITDGINDPIAVAIGSSGYLNVANYYESGPGSVTEYAPNSTKVARKILDGVDGPASLAFGP